MDIFQMFGGPSPEEIERNRMGAQLTEARVNNFIDGLGPEDLSTLGIILMGASNSEDNLLVGKLLGNVDTLFRIHYPTYCKGCGTEHGSDRPHNGFPDDDEDKKDNIFADADLDAVVDPIAPNATDPIEAALTMAEMDKYNEEAMKKFEQPTLFEAVDADVPSTPADNTAANMVAYRVKASKQFDGHGVECTDCGLYYVSLADRMLKDPDDCHGCIQKAKWG